jgi:hypothetical protein
VRFGESIVVQRPALPVVTHSAAAKARARSSSVIATNTTNSPRVSPQRRHSAPDAVGRTKKDSAEKQNVSSEVVPVSVEKAADAEAQKSLDAGSSIPADAIPALPEKKEHPENARKKSWWKSLLTRIT